MLVNISFREARKLLPGDAIDRARECAHVLTPDEASRFTLRIVYHRDAKRWFITTWRYRKNIERVAELLGITPSEVKKREVA